MPSAENQQQLDIAAERAQCTFDPSQLTALFYGGEEKMKRLKAIEAMVDREPVFDRTDRYFLGRTEVIEEGICWLTSPIEHNACIVEQKVKRRRDGTNNEVTSFSDYFFRGSRGLCPW